MATRKIKQKSIFDGIEMGIGTWAWGEKFYWGFGNGYGEEEIAATFKKCVESGIRFFDTAEAYGLSESFVGKFLGTTKEKLIVATKFVPYPWRLTKHAVATALKNSLKKLNRSMVDLYQLHFPFPPLPLETWLEGFIEQKEKGLIGEIGVSNHNLNQMLRAVECLERHGLKLASNQLEYSLLDRQVEKNGILAECQKLGIKLIAYSPLAMGVLTGKYDAEHPLKGLRGSRYPRAIAEKAQPLISSMKKIGNMHGGKTPAQVALNWIIRKGALPIPGAKTVTQAEQNIGAMGWKLTVEEMDLLDELSERVASTF
jgi:aryl-alcohol dehydrogenase-like predicted oxidoreductase